MNRIGQRLLGPLLACAALLGLAAPARAAYPDHQITMIVCFPPGGGSDVIARIVSQPLWDALGQPVVVENRAGAGGNVGIGTVARAQPDGYTFLLCSSAYVVNPSLYAKVPYDPLKDFVPVFNFGASPNVYTVRAGSSIKSIADLVAEAKAAPGKMNYTSSGIGTTPQLSGEVLKLKAGIDVVHIPFPGAGPAVAATLAGQVDYLVTSLSSVSSQVDAGTLRAIAQTGEQRWPGLPDVPTLVDLGYPGTTSETFQALFAPAGTPRPVIDRVVAELTKILARPEIREAFRRAGSTDLAEGPDQFRARIERELPMYKAIIEAAGLARN